MVRHGMPERTPGNCGSLDARYSISSAQATADRASGKTSMKAYRICLTMRPLQAPTELRTIREKRSRTPAAATSPMASASGVKLERSMKTIAINRSAGVAALFTSPCCSAFFFSSRRRHTRFDCDWSSDVCSSDLLEGGHGRGDGLRHARVADEHRRGVRGDLAQGQGHPLGQPVQVEDVESGQHDGGDRKSVV